MTDNGEAMASALFLSERDGIPSIAVAFLGFNPLSVFPTFEKVLRARDKIAIENVAVIFHFIRSPSTFSSSQAVVSSFSGSHRDLLNLTKLVSKIPLFLSFELHSHNIT